MDILIEPVNIALISEEGNTIILSQCLKTHTNYTIIISVSSHSMTYYLILDVRVGC